MKLSDITLEHVKDYLNINYDDEDTEIELLMNGVEQHIKDYTGLTDEQIDDKPNLSIAYMVLVNELYTNRQYTVASDKANQVVEQILGMYSVNLL